MSLVPPRELELRELVSGLVSPGGGWTVDTLAAELRKPAETIQQWSQGEGLPTAAEKQRLRALAGLGVSWNGVRW